MRLFIKNTIYLIFFIVISSCSYRWEGPHKMFKDDLKDATPDFREGWYDGCEVGRATGGSTYYRTFAKNNKINGWKMANSQDYQIAWSYGFWFCYRDDHVDQKRAPFKSFFGGMQ